MKSSRRKERAGSPKGAAPQGQPQKPSSATVSPEFIETVRTRLAANKRIRRVLPERGLLHLDRQLPFVCVYRHPPDRPDAGTQRLVQGEASYLIASGSRRQASSVGALVRGVAETLVAAYGGLLLIEIWSAPTPEEIVATPAPDPLFRILAPARAVDSPTLSCFEKSLAQVKLQRRSATVMVDTERKAAPPGLKRIMPPREAKELGCLVVGLEVSPVFRDATSGNVIPQLLRAVRRGLGVALKQTFFAFACNETTHRPPHFHALGRRAVVKAVWDVDRQLSEISDSYDFLLQVTPVNSQSAFREFKRGKFKKSPAFRYRPSTVEPALLKRRLFNIPIERVEDPTLAHLFRQKQEEVDREITLLAEIGSRRFLYESLQLYGEVEPELVESAKMLLAAIPSRGVEGGQGFLDAEAFAARARKEIEHYRALMPTFWATVHVQRDLYAGLLVSRTRLLVGKQAQIPVSRVDALLQHEVGTHLVTYFNGLAQPLRQLHSGLAGYDELQEGLAVLAEYLVGGLSRPRLRLLAARVLAARLMTEGASFVDTFRLLERTYGFSQRLAFMITVRVYRGGGLTKDAVYLRGLVEVLNHLASGGELSPLFVGKIAAEHLPLIHELQHRKVLKPTPLLPRFMTYPEATERLALLRQGVTLLDLVNL